MSAAVYDTIKDEYYMRIALSEAVRGTGSVSPNPLVGCVITDSEGHILSIGRHKRYGGAHAEADALSKLPEVPRGAVLYVNLEPCSHTGHTPPCADAIIKKGISRVVIGMTDPNPIVSGRGIAMLERAGVKTVLGVLEQECRWLNRGFIMRMTHGRPWVTLKAALSADGRMAVRSGDSKWLTSEMSRVRAHLLRSENDMIIVGAGTARHDDPELTVRHSDGSSPVRVVVSSSGDLDLSMKVFNEDAPSCAAVPHDLPDSICDGFERKGVSLIRVDKVDAHLDISSLLKRLAEAGACRVLVEGGPELACSLLAEGAVDGFSLFIAPKFAGDGRGLADRIVLDMMDEAIDIDRPVVREIGGDVWMEGVSRCSLALLNA